MLFTTAQKVTKHLGYFCYKICCQEFSKIAQSGHTGHGITSSKLLPNALDKDQDALSGLLVYKMAHAQPLFHLVLSC